MGFTTNQAVDSTPPVPETETAEPTPDEPTPEEVRDYIADAADITAEQVKEEAAAYQDEFKIVGDLAAYYLVGQEHGVNPAEAFETEDTPELDVVNIQPRMQVTTTATIDSTEIVDPDGKDWTRQDVQLADESGTVKLVLWNDDVRDDISAGDEVELVDCWAKEYNGSVQVKLGKGGRIEIVDERSG